MPRFTGVLHFWVNYSFYFSSFAINGGDQIALLCSFYLLPFTLLDSRKWHWFGKSGSGNSILAKSIIINFYFLIRIQTALIYLVAVVSKFNVKEWANGTALYYWFNNQSFGIPDHLSFLLPLFDNDIILSFTTYSVLIFELTLFLGLSMVKSGKRILLIMAVLFHFSIFYFTDFLASFSL
jgi:antimicrobial peptide system SdpB family protein